MDNGTFSHFLQPFAQYPVGLEFSAFIATGSKLVTESAGNFSSKQVRKALAQLSAYLENHSEFSESTVLTFCSGISSWFRLLTGFPKYRKLVLKVILFLFFIIISL